MFMVKRFALACLLVGILAAAAAAQTPHSSTEGSTAAALNGAQEKKSLYARLAVTTLSRRLLTISLADSLPTKR